MKDVQCYELFGGIALRNHAFSFHFILRYGLYVAYRMEVICQQGCNEFCETWLPVELAYVHSAFNLLVFPNSMFTPLLLFFY